MPYVIPQQGEWVLPVLEGYKMRCCDCGLVHRMDFKAADDGQPMFRVFRDERATGQSRRWRKWLAQVCE